MPTIVTSSIDELLHATVPGGFAIATKTVPLVVAEAVSTLGGLDILVNNVGVAYMRVGGFLSVSDEDWTGALTLTILAAVRTTRAALSHLLERKASTIVTICSVNSFLPDPAVIDWSAAKAALANCCKALSKEVADLVLLLASDRAGNVTPYQSPGPYATVLSAGCPLGDGTSCAAVEGG